MDKLEQGDNGSYIDLESGWTVREEDRLPANAPKKKSLKRAFGGVLRFEGFADSKPGIPSSILRYGEVASDRFADRFLRENRPLNIPFSGKMQQPKPSSRKPPKPPRPPKPPLLNDIDRKLAKDAAEVAIRKRARIEQMKAQKKKVASNASASSSSSSIVALFITVLFFVIMIYQGMSSQNAVALHHNQFDFLDSESPLTPIQPSKTLDSSEKGSFIPPHPYNSAQHGE